jgi:uncharacterized protein YndB with AHSA1/START domain
MTTAELSVKKSVLVNVPIAHAFEVFTKRFDLWWPRAHHIGKVDMKEAIIEPREGGRWYEKGVDGSECDWGKVLAWAPPNKVALSWHLQGDFTYNADPAHASRVEVTFTEEAGRTRVELVHSGIERAIAGERLKDSVSAEGGWPTLMELFAKAAAA